MPPIGILAGLFTLLQESRSVLRPGAAPAGVAARVISATLPEIRWLLVRVTEDLREVCVLSDGVMSLGSSTPIRSIVVLSQVRGPCKGFGPFNRVAASLASWRTFAEAVSGHFSRAAITRSRRPGSWPTAIWRAWIALS